MVISNEILQLPQGKKSWVLTLSKTELTKFSKGAFKWDYVCYSPSRGPSFVEGRKRRVSQTPPKPGAAWISGWYDQSSMVLCSPA